MQIFSHSDAGGSFVVDDLGNSLLVASTTADGTTNSRVLTRESVQWIVDQVRPALLKPQAVTKRLKFLVTPPSDVVPPPPAMNFTMPFPHAVKFISLLETWLRQ